jgi:hypothetical protein
MIINEEFMLADLKKAGVATDSLDAAGIKTAWDRLVEETTNTVYKALDEERAAAKVSLKIEKFEGVLPGSKKVTDEYNQREMVAKVISCEEHKKGFVFHLEVKGVSRCMAYGDRPFSPGDLVIINAYVVDPGRWASKDAAGKHTTTIVPNGRKLVMEVLYGVDAATVSRVQIGIVMGDIKRNVVSVD